MALSLRRTIINLLFLGTLLVFFSCKDGEEQAYAFVKARFQKQERFVFRQGLTENDSTEIVRALSKDTNYCVSASTGKILKFVFSPKDRQELSQQLGQLRSTGWYSSLKLENAIGLPLNRIEADYESSKTDFPETWPYVDQRSERVKIYTFSKPLFFRDNTLCAFYCGYTDGELSGGGDFMLYRKEGKEWKKWLILFWWAN